ncbi:MAG: NAD-dependent epimerase/dehydratase family protein [Christensenellales bacterium]|jgi:dihydroflavonol-4-reductase
MALQYLVTGANGHLGSAILRELDARGAAVRALVLPGEPLELDPEKVEIVRGDILDNSSLDRFFSLPADTRIRVIHAAGIVTISSRDNPLVRKVNVEGTRNIVEACLRHKAEKLVYVSSVHAIPEEKGRVITETKDFSPDKVEGLYARTKAEATRIVLDAAKAGLDASVVHPSGIIGPYDTGRNHLTQLVKDFVSGKLKACVTGGYDIVDVRDVAKGVVSACEKGGRGECYILSNRYVSIPELLKTLGELVGRKVPRALPLWFAKATAPLAELYYKLRRTPPLFTAYSLKTLATRIFYSHAKADRELGYTTTDLKTTLADTLAWLQLAPRMA